MILDRFKKKILSLEKIKNKDKTDVNTIFVRNICHRMGIENMTKISPTASILYHDPGDKIPEFVDQLFTIGNEYNKKLKDIIDYSEIVNGDFVSVSETLLVRNVLSYASTNAKDRMKNLSDNSPIVNIVFDKGVPVSELTGDSRSTTMILEELIFNGLRHSMDNTVHIEVWSDKYDPTIMFFSVKNTGVTITPEDMSSLFTPFKFTTTSKDVVQSAGVGLGLAKCKKLAEIIGGELDVESGDVTMFTLRVPFKHIKELVFNNISLSLNQERKDISMSNSTNPSEEGIISVLVVDDSKMILKMFDKMLTSIGIKVEVCSEPLLCLYKVSVTKYDAIFLDNIMPVMTGIACAHEIRRGETMNKNTPILVVTADSSTETRQLTSYIPESILLEKPARLSVVVRSLMAVIKDKSKLEYLEQHCVDLN